MPLVTHWPRQTTFPRSRRPRSARRPGRRRAVRQCSQLRDPHTVSPANLLWPSPSLSPAYRRTPRHDAVRQPPEEDRRVPSGFTDVPDGLMLADALGRVRARRGRGGGSRGAAETWGSWRQKKKPTWHSKRVAGIAVFLCKCLICSFKNVPHLWIEIIN